MHDAARQTEALPTRMIPMSLGSRIDALLDQPKITELVTAYFDPDGPFAGHTFDGLGGNPPTQFTPDDLLAVSLLDVSYGPAAVRQILEHSYRWSPLLEAVPPEAVLWEMDEEVYGAADQLWKALVALAGVGPTKAGKLLARKRPSLVPIFDDVIATFLPPGDRGFWWGLQGALLDSTRRDRLNALAENITPSPATIRILDVAVWMRCSNSNNARRVRQDAGVPLEPLAEHP